MARHSCAGMQLDGSPHGRCRFVLQAKVRAATIVHVDPPFTRTSALADIYAPIRAGTDIAFLGGIIHHLLEQDPWFREYAVEYTNLATIIDERFSSASEADGLFSGWDPKGETSRPIRPIRMSSPPTAASTFRTVRAAQSVLSRFRRARTERSRESARPAPARASAA